MQGFLQTFQILGSVLSTQMTGHSSKQTKMILIALCILGGLGYWMQSAGGQR